MRRALRIFPLYYGFLVAATLAGKTPAWEFWVYLQNYASTFGRDIGFPSHFWSLAVEEHFYFVWPILVLRAKRRHLPRIAFALLLFSIAARAVRAYLGLDTFSPTDCRLDGLAFGALLALAYEAGRLKSLLKYCYAALPGVVVVIGIIFLRFGGQHSPFFQVAKTLLFSILYAAAIAVVLGAQLRKVNATLEAKPLRLVGRVSYGLYVFHPVVIALLARRTGVSLPLQGVLTFLLSFAVAWLSWTFYEKRFLMLKARFE